MARAHYIQGPDGRLYTDAEFARRWPNGAARSPNLHAPMVIGDISPYRSVIDGREIAGRRQHRDHLREHGCVEVGNEWVEPRRCEPEGVKEAVIDAVQQVMS